MTRLSRMPVTAWDDELRMLMQADGATNVERSMGGVMAHAPALAKALMVFGGKFWTQHTLPRRLLELIRLRVAFHNQCRTCMAIRYQSAVDDGLTENMVCSLEKPFEAADLTEAEKAAIQYADLSATNHFAINDETFVNLRRYYSEAEIVELGMFIAYFIGFGRLLAAWDLTEELPQTFQDKTAKAVPWAGESVRLRS